MWFAKMFGLSWPCYARFIQHPRSSLSSWMEPNPKTPNRELVGFLWLQSLLHHMTISPLLFVPIFFFFFFYSYKTKIALEMKAVWQDFDLGKENVLFKLCQLQQFRKISVAIGWVLGERRGQTETGPKTHYGRKGQSLLIKCSSGV